MTVAHVVSVATIIITLRVVPGLSGLCFCRDDTNISHQQCCCYDNATLVATAYNVNVAIETLALVEESGSQSRWNDTGTFVTVAPFVCVAVIVLRLTPASVL